MLGLAILLIVAILGAMTPGLHLQASWPLPVRFNEAAWTSLQLRGSLVAAVVTTFAGVVCLSIAASLRHWRWINTACGLAALAIAAFAFRDLTVPAFPTSFYASPTGYSVASIARGHTLFDQHCVACHGSDGRGRGSLGANLPAKLADLTADHIYDHSNGDLFWWISHGIDRAMPGFATTIDDDGRWQLIDFIHANADALRLRRSNTGSFPLPDFTADCPDGSTLAASDARGRIVHVVMAGPNTMDRLRELAAMHLTTDIVTVAIVPERTLLEDVPFCVSSDPDVARALAIYRGNGGATEGTEFLIDSTGQLRALWYPGLQPAWTDPTVLSLQFANVRNPAKAPSRLPTSTHHMH
jgi:mono/diheme cytochrome c family protein